MGLVQADVGDTRDVQVDDGGDRRVHAVHGREPEGHDLTGHVGAVELGGQGELLGAQESHGIPGDLLPEVGQGDAQRVGDGGGQGGAGVPGHVLIRGHLDRDLGLDGDGQRGLGLDGVAG